MYYYRNFKFVKIAVFMHSLRYSVLLADQEGDENDTSPTSTIGSPSPNGGLKT